MKLTKISLGYKENDHLKYKNKKINQFTRTN